MAKLVPLAGVLGVLITVAALDFFVSGGSNLIGGWPIFTVLAVLAFVIQWIVFVPAFVQKSEHYFDLTGSATFVTLAILALLLDGSFDLRSVTIAVLVAIWAVRLGSFLSGRVREAGFDRRFTTIKTNFGLFFLTWSIQGFWVVMSFACGLAAMTSINKTPVDVFLLVGLLIWIAGFAIEVTADRQKTAFRADPANAQKFITSGLWARSRHPNYFGEIVLWLGIAVIAFPNLDGGELVALVSPLFIVLQLTKISGVRMLDNRAKRAWGEDPDYIAYRKATPMLIPRLTAPK